MEGSIGYIVGIIVLVLAMNFFFVFRRMRRDSPKKLGRAAVQEEKQAIWREKEVQRRIDREQDDAYERVKLKNETLALYEEVRRRAHAREIMGIERDGTEAKSAENDPGEKTDKE